VDIDFWDPESQIRAQADMHLASTWVDQPFCLIKVPMRIAGTNNPPLLCRLTTMGLLKPSVSTSNTKESFGRMVPLMFITSFF
jgi:hypothetical protein